VLDYLGNQSFILFFGILLVQDAVLLVAETDAGEEVGRGRAGVGVRNIVESDRSVGSPSDKRTVFGASRHAFVHQLRVPADVGDVDGILSQKASETVTHVLDRKGVETKMGLAGITKFVTATLGAIHDPGVFMHAIFDQFIELFSQGFDCGKTSRIHLRNFGVIVFLGIRFVPYIKLLIPQIGGHETIAAVGTIVQEPGIKAGPREKYEFAVMVLLSPDHLVRLFAMTYVETIETPNAVVHVLRIVRILRLHHGVRKIGMGRILREIRIIGVLRIYGP
jgi:hypothetical protein